MYLTLSNDTYIFINIKNDDQFQVTLSYIVQHFSLYVILLLCAIISRQSLLTFITLKTKVTSLCHQSGQPVQPRILTWLYTAGRSSSSSYHDIMGSSKRWKMDCSIGKVLIIRTFHGAWSICFHKTGSSVSYYIIVSCCPIY